MGLIKKPYTESAPLAERRVQAKTRSSDAAREITGTRDGVIVMKAPAFWQETGWYRGAFVPLR